jgi:glutamate/tyrosine decarboxylase-like PLP-dependent enzyme
VDLSAGDSIANFDEGKLLATLRGSNTTVPQVDKIIAFILVATFGEVNTGQFTSKIRRLKGLCEQVGGWLHIDAAFGILARIHSGKRGLVEGLELADSIAFDGHKFLNVPYDCGVFLTRHMDVLSRVCGNTGAAYLTSAEGDYSPLNISLENSRRFRALPVYASLLSLGKEGYVDIVQRCCSLAAQLGEEIMGSNKFVLLEPVVFNIVLFQAMGCETVEANERVKDAINATGKVYLSGTKWKGQGALRIAICNHLVAVNAEEEASEILKILGSVVP